MTDETTTAPETTPETVIDPATEAALDGIRTKLGLSRKDVSDLTGLTQAVIYRLGKLAEKDVTASDATSWTLVEAALRKYELENPAGKPKAAPKAPKAPKTTGVAKAEISADVQAALTLAQSAYVAAKAKKYSTAELTKVVDTLLALAEKYKSE